METREGFKQELLVTRCFKIVYLSHNDDNVQFNGRQKKKNIYLKSIRNYDKRVLRFLFFAQLNQIKSTD